jgi:hypothetical protein
MLAGALFTEYRFRVFHGNTLSKLRAAAGKEPSK